MDKSSTPPDADSLGADDPASETAGDATDDGTDATADEPASDAQPDGSDGEAPAAAGGSSMDVTTGGTMDASDPMDGVQPDPEPTNEEEVVEEVPVEEEEIIPPPPPDFGPSEDGPTIVAYSPVTAVKGQLHVTADYASSDMELRLAGELLEAIEFPRGYAGTAIYHVPPQLEAGEFTVGVRKSGAETDSDTVQVELVDPIFADISQASGLSQVHDVTGHDGGCVESKTGIAIADYDNDGDNDVYVGNYGADGRLFSNQGDTDEDGLPDFVEVTGAAALTGIDQVSTATFADLDNDGDQDLFVGRHGADRYFQNRLVEDGTATFVDATEAVGLGVYEQHTSSFGLGDYDGDGDLDLYLAHNTWCNIGDPEPRRKDHLYRNDGGTLVEVTDLLGGGDYPRLDVVSFAALWVDADRDGDQDLMVMVDDIDDSGSSVLWRNDGDSEGGWVFTDVTEASGFIVSDGGHAMGAALADINFDGYPEVAFSSTAQGNWLLVHDGPGTLSYTDRSAELGIQRAELQWAGRSVTWGTNFLDFDNDSEIDLFYTGGAIRNPRPTPNALLQADGAGGFVEVTWEAGLADNFHGKGSALVDLDQDGLQELLVANFGEDLRTYRNQSAELGNDNHWLTVTLQGTADNRDALGTIVEVDTGLPAAKTQTCFMTQRPSNSAGGERTCHFGLGENVAVDAIRIYWPNGSVQTPAVPAVDQRVHYVQD